MTAQSEYAVVLPPALVEPAREVRFEPDELLRVLYREIKCDCVDSSPRLTTPHGGLRMWVRDDSLIRDDIEHNDRAIGLCRAIGYNVPDVGGVAVFTGIEDPAGDTLGLGDELRRVLMRAFEMSIDPVCPETQRADS